MPDLTPAERQKRKDELLLELGEIHYAWVDTHKDNIDFNPGRDTNPHAGKMAETSDYSFHSLDRSATADQEEDFAKRTAHILEELKTL